MYIPQKSQKGANLRAWIVSVIDALIDCVTSLRLRPGPGIEVRETPTGTIVSLARQSGSRPAAAGQAAMVKAGEGMRIDNGTASSVYVPGGTATSVPVNGATFTCTVEGGTSGGGGSGIGIPDWGMSAHNTGADGVTDIGNADLELVPNGAPVVLDANASIYAFAEFECATANETRASAHLVVNGAMFKVASCYNRSSDDAVTGAGGGIAITALSGSTVSFVTSIPVNEWNHREGCVVYYI